ncbi:hypothetical protein TRL7639_03540 [Falsiruegeria litorea R37]|uniref:Uncharacterized protein n=1 Tax=Falsiruegeria litorea R37 TaxID=1200284 RepID=A0A1Y5TGE4_9RHOB|nr:DUF2459 domain-containing protein [Falsiruegeria litorea]SLN63086.1 hypothetical protein TRL7639_03540 [Falsiruegeria litorea R37]
MVRTALWLVLALVAFPVLYGLAATAGALVNLADGQLDREGETEILLVSGQIHYDFLLPLTPLTRRQFARLAKYGQPLNHPDAQWLLIGWGAREFYTTTGNYSDVSAKAVMRGIFGDTSVIRTDVLGRLTPKVDALRDAGHPFGAWVPLPFSVSLSHRMFLQSEY